MGDIADDANDWLRDFVTEGMPDSGDNDPEKAAGRELFALLDGLLYGVRASNAGTSAPADPVFGTPWLDTTNKLLKIYDGASWVSLFSIDTVTHTAALATAQPPLLRAYLSGLTLSTPGSSASFGITAGVAADSGNAAMISLAATLNKTTSAWAVGNTNGGLDTGTIANNTWYHAWLIKRPDTGVVDALLSLSASSPTMPVNYTLKRRIGSLLTNGSAQFVSFSQTGDYFTWAAPVVDASSTNPGTSAVFAALPSIPLGIIVKWVGTAMLRIGSAASSLYVSGPAANNAAPQLYDAAGPVTPGFTLANAVANTMAAQRMEVLSDNAQRIRWRLSASDASTIVGMVTHGWIDTRGRDD